MWRVQRRNLKEESGVYREVEKKEIYSEQCIAQPGIWTLERMNILCCRCMHHILF